MSFKDFTKLFPKADFPLHFGEDTYRSYEASGKLVPDEAIAEFIAPMEPELDEFTEVLACAKFSRKEYTALVYWKAGLLHNHYRLVTFDKKRGAGREPRHRRELHRWRGREPVGRHDHRGSHDLRRECARGHDRGVGCGRQDFGAATRNRRQRHYPGSRRMPKDN